MSKRTKRTLLLAGAWGVGIFLLAAYFGCVVSSVFKGPQGAILNPFRMFKWAYVYGFPSYMFLLFLVLFVAIFGGAIMHSLNSELARDTLQRKFYLPKKRKTYGEAHFEEPEEYKDAAVIRSPEAALGPIVGQLDDSNTKLITALTKKKTGNNHFAVFGLSGSGKSYTVTNNFIFQAVRRRESLIISDPDGGLEKLQRGYLISHGYVVRTLNLQDLDKSDGWDCLKSLASDTPEITDVKSQIFAYACIANTMEGARKDIYFNGPLLLLRALILRVYLGTAINGRVISPEERNIKTVYEQLLQDNEEEYLNQLFEEAQMNEEEKRCLAPWRNFNNSSQNLRGNLIVNLGTLLQPLMTEKVATVLSTDEIDLELPGEVPCAYFCQFPDTHDTYKFVVSLFFSMIIQCLVDKADATPSGKLKVPVNFLLDEFPSLGVLPDWARKMSVVRKRNINVVMIFQNIMQLQANYQDDWVSILQNCGTLVSLGVNDEYTAAFLQKRIGTTTIEVETKSHDGTEGVFRLRPQNYSSGEGKRDLLSLDEIFKLNENNSLILFNTHNAIIARKYPYIYHPEAKLLCDDPLGEKPSFDNKAGRKIRQQAEEAFLRRFYQDHPGLVHRDEEADPAPPTKMEVARKYASTIKREIENRAVKTLPRDAGTVTEIVRIEAHPILSAGELDWIYTEVDCSRIAEESTLPDNQTGQVENGVVMEKQVHQKPLRMVTRTASNMPPVKGHRPPVAPQ